MHQGSLEATDIFVFILHSTMSGQEWFVLVLKMEHPEQNGEVLLLSWLCKSTLLSVQSGRYFLLGQARVSPECTRKTQQQFHLPPFSFHQSVNWLCRLTNFLRRKHCLTNLFFDCVTCRAQSSMAMFLFLVLLSSTYSKWGPQHETSIKLTMSTLWVCKC